jgi:hypothetical protein
MSHKKVDLDLLDRESARGAIVTPLEPACGEGTIEKALPNSMI